MDRDAVLAFRLARSGLAGGNPRGLAAAATVPAADFSRDAALLALSARRPKLTREEFDAAIDDGGEIVVARAPRGAIHVLRAADLSLFGAALIAADDEELGRQLGRRLRQLAEEKGFAPSEALTEVAAATKKALGRGRRLTMVELHEQLRGLVGDDLLPWCKGCESHHVPPMLWRYATAAVGARLDSERRYLLAKSSSPPPAAEALRRFLAAYGPSTPAEFAEWANAPPAMARRLWEEIEDELAEASVGRDQAWALAADEAELASPPTAEGVVLLPPGDPYLQKPNRHLLAPDKELRKRLFPAVGAPGVVLADGHLVALWRARLKGKKLALEVEKLGRVARAAIEPEAERIAAIRGAELELST